MFGFELEREMTLTLELPQDLEYELTAEANKLGLPVAEYALRLLHYRPVVENMPGTGRELVDYWQKADLVGSRPDIENSQEYARQLRHEAETRIQP
jgi:hypothetical protein